MPTWTRRSLVVPIAGLLLPLMLAASVPAAPISITNPSFEDPVLPSDNSSTIGGINGWTTTSTVVGVARNLSTIPIVRDGVQWAFANEGSVSQTLAAVLTADTAYSLSVDFLRQIGCTLCVDPTVSLSLLVGATVLASDVFSYASVTEGEVETHTVNAVLPSSLDRWGREF